MNATTHAATAQIIVQPGDGAATEDASQVISARRGHVDALDDRIIALIQERMETSAAIQRERIATGGPRVSLTRENQVLGRYSEALGKPGTAVALRLLELCRGRI